MTSPMEMNVNTTAPSANAASYRILCEAQWSACRAEELFWERGGSGASQEWRDLHAAAREACSARTAEARRLALEDRCGDWPTPADRQLMLFGYL